MLSVSEALHLILSEINTTALELVEIDRAYGRVLAGDIIAPFDLPPFTSSSMDGFAVRSVDIASASTDNPVSLRVIDDIPAGKTSTRSLGYLEAMRIMTGAVLPSGADAVVPLESTSSSQRGYLQSVPNEVVVFESVQEGDYLRIRGQDLKRGELILFAGRRLRPQDVGFLVMLGNQNIQVFKKPRVGIISTGDELLRIKEPITSGMVYDANSYTLAGLVAHDGGEVVFTGIARDSEDEVRSCMRQCINSSVDLIISSAGVSVGAFDYVRSVIESEGKLTFWRVNIRPGKPLAFGHYAHAPIFGLPGNPVSAFVGYKIFVRPALKKMTGIANWVRERTKVKLGDMVESDGRESYLRAKVRLENGEFIAYLTGNQSSGNLYSLVQANAFIIIPSEVKSLPIGTLVDAWLLDENNE